MNINNYINSLPFHQGIIDRIIRETILDKGEEYIHQERTEFEMKNFPFCTLFVWNKTKEGFDYWSDINNIILDR